MPPITQYTTLARLRRKNALRDVETNEMTDKIASVSARMNSFFRERYTLPFIQVGLDVSETCDDIVTWELLVDRGVNPVEGSGDDALRIAHDRALAWLKMVANPSAGVSPDVTDSSSGATEAPFIPRARVKSQSRRGFDSVGLSGVAGSPPIPRIPGWPDGTA